MTPIRSALIWAAAMLLVALANRHLLIADKDALAMFAVMPGIWVVTTSSRRGRCARRGVAQ